MGFVHWVLFESQGGKAVWGPGASICTDPIVPRGLTALRNLMFNNKERGQKWEMRMVVSKSLGEDGNGYAQAHPGGPSLPTGAGASAVAITSFLQESHI